MINLRGHPTEQVQCPHGSEEIIDIDVKLVPLIKSVWNVGIRTRFCCQEANPGLAYIHFFDVNDVQDFLQIADEYYFVEFASHWYRVSRKYPPRPEYAGPRNPAHEWSVFLSVHFPTKDIPKLVRRFRQEEHRLAEIEKKQEAKEKNRQKKKGKAATKKGGRKKG